MNRNLTHAIRWAIALTGLVWTFTPLVAQAQTDGDSWQWRASIYGWLPAIKGDTQFPSGGSGPSIDVATDDLLSSLEFAFMGSLQAKKGSWGILTDLVYASVGGSNSGLREFTVGQAELPASVSLDAKLDLNTWVWTLGGTYAIRNTEQTTTDFLFGARMLDLKQTLDWSFSGNIDGLQLPGHSGTSVAEGTNWDAIIGIRGQTFPGTDQRWFLPYHLDAGTGDSDLTWQAIAGIGYRFDWGSTVLSYRHLDYEMESDATLENASFSGLLLGAAFEW